MKVFVGAAREPPLQAFSFSGGAARWDARLAWAIINNGTRARAFTNKKGGVNPPLFEIFLLSPVYFFLVVFSSSTSFFKRSTSAVYCSTSASAILGSS